MPPKFSKSANYTTLTKYAETEILDRYAELLEDAPDVLLSHIPAFFRGLKVPPCFTNDINTCIQWIYDTGLGNVSRTSAKWHVAEQLLRHLTISATVNGDFDVSDIVDLDKLLQFSNRLLRFRDHYREILRGWKLFADACGYSGPVSDFQMSMKTLGKVKSRLQLDDISDSILIDMLGCSKTTVEGEIFNYTFLAQGLVVTIKDFAEVLGQLGELD